jgi:hypothetical protein
LIIGVDPGNSGAACLLNDDGQPVSFCRFDWTERDVADWFFAAARRAAVRVVIERVHAMPKQGVASTFKFGAQYGFVRGVICGCQLPFKETTPLKWQSVMKCRSKGDKNVTKQAAQQLWPTVKITHRVADSILIAEYGRRYLWSD